MACQRNTATVSQSTTWPKVVLFGDSITQFSFSNDGCWGSMLADLLQRKCDVINRGFSGYNSRWCVKILSKVFEEFASSDVAMVTIFLGANDSNLPANSHQHVPAEEYKSHLISMVEKLQMCGIPREKILLITPPACDVVAWGADCSLNVQVKKLVAHISASTLHSSHLLDESDRVDLVDTTYISARTLHTGHLSDEGRQCHKCNKTAGLYASLCKESATEMGTGCVDLYTEMMKLQDWQQLLNDGLHLSTRGSELLFNLMKPFVVKLTSEIEAKFPDWKDVDNTNPDASLC